MDNIRILSGSRFFNYQAHFGERGSYNIPFPKAIVEFSIQTFPAFNFQSWTLEKNNAMSYGNILEIPDIRHII